MDPLYDYVSEIANRMYPTWEFDDSCGEYFQTDSFRGWDFVHQLEDGRLKCPFTKEQYLENAPIIRSLRAMGIDTEKFWMAMLFVYDVVQERTENVQQVPDLGIRGVSDFRQVPARKSRCQNPCMARARARRDP